MINECISYKDINGLPVALHQHVSEMTVGNKIFYLPPKLFYTTYFVFSYAGKVLPPSHFEEWLIKNRGEKNLSKSQIKNMQRNYICSIRKLLDLGTAHPLTIENKIAGNRFINLSLDE